MRLFLPLVPFPSSFPILFSFVSTLILTLTLPTTVEALAPNSYRTPLPANDPIRTRVDRYAAFAAAAYDADGCVFPPFGAEVVEWVGVKYDHGGDGCGKGGPWEEPGDWRGSEVLAAIFRDNGFESGVEDGYAERHEKDNGRGGDGGAAADGDADGDHPGPAIIVAFRGTYSPANLDSDLEVQMVPLELPGVPDCEGCMVHAGFQSALSPLLPPLLTTLCRIRLEHPLLPLVLTGHSFGGALASLAAAAVPARGNGCGRFDSSRSRSSKRKRRSTGLAVYTYGEPRNANAAFAAFLATGHWLWDRHTEPAPDPTASSDSSSGSGSSIGGLDLTRDYVRVTHADDGVPQLPPAWLARGLGLVHHGLEIWQVDEIVGVDGDTTVVPATGVDSGHDSAAYRGGEEGSIRPRIRQVMYKCPPRNSGRGSLNKAAVAGGDGIGESPACVNSQWSTATWMGRAHLHYSGLLMGSALGVDVCGAREYCVSGIW